MSSKKADCPECREKWEGFPKVNILLRDAIEKLFPDAIKMRVEDIQQNKDAVQSLTAFQKYGNDQSPLAPSTGRVNPQRRGGFFSGVLTALTGVAVILLVYHWRSRESEHGLPGAQGCIQMDDGRSCPLVRAARTLGFPIQKQVLI